MPPSEPSDAPDDAKLEALYHFAYGLSHEINNPLANIATRAQTLLAGESEPGRRRALATIVQQAFRAHEMIADLMLFARPPALAPEKVDLAGLADRVVAELAEQAAEQQTALVRGGVREPLVVRADPAQLAVALKALVQNALEAVAQGGSVEVAILRLAPVADSPLPPEGAGDSARGPVEEYALRVTDTGPGIADAIRPHLFDPFFSGREAGRGLGLGLSKAWRIVRLHGGRIEVASAPGQTLLTIVLPREPATSHQPPDTSH
jgi:hypothetical protein